MDKIQAAVVTIGVGMTVAALFGMLFPNGNIKKAGETGMTILLLFLLVTPFLQIGDTGRILSESPAYDLETYTQANIYENAVERCIENTLTTAGYAVYDVEATVQLGEDNTVCLQTLQISVEKETNTEEVLRILQNDFEIPSEIVAVQGE